MPAPLLVDYLHLLPEEITRVRQLVREGARFPILGDVMQIAVSSWASGDLLRMKQTHRALVSLREEYEKRTGKTSKRPL